VQHTEVSPSHFFRAGKPVTVYRDSRGRFAKKPAEKPKFYRAVISLNGVPFNHVYRNFTLQRIDTLESETLDKQKMIEKLEKYIKKEIGYSKEDMELVNLHWLKVEYGWQSPREEPNAFEPSEYYEHTTRKRKTHG